MVCVYGGYTVILTLSFLLFYETAALFNTGISILLLFLISLNYNSDIKHKIIAVAFNFSFYFLAELIAYGVLKMMGIINNPFPFEKAGFVVGRLVSEILLYLIVILFGNYKKSEKSADVPVLYWVASLFVPLLSLIPSILVIMGSGGDTFVLIFVTLALVVLNITVFYLYDGLMESYQSKLEQEILVVQNKSYKEQLDILENSTLSMKIFKHDSINHMTVLKSMLLKGDYKEAITYLDEMTEYIRSNSNFVSTGNSGVDCLLNYKIQEAANLNIEVHYDISIPETLDVLPFDLVAILGNLFDNAIYSVDKLETDRNIEFKMNYGAKILKIEISNKMNDTIRISANAIDTNKPDKENHGSGLKSIKKIVDKYCGELIIEINSDTFRVQIMLVNESALPNS